jgi:hypothetical protein
MQMIVFFVCLLFLTVVSPAKVSLEVPYFCVDKAVLDVFAPRLACLGLGQGVDILEGLGSGKVGASELQHAQELVAFKWFVQELRNPYRVDCSDPRVRLEYVPLLPLHWISINMGDAVSVGNSSNSSFLCSYSALIRDIETYIDLRKPSSRKLFAVAGTENLRTQMGVYGMSSNVRRGSQYDTVTSFVTSVLLGHYERFPQCPDLLRKHWPGVLEIPSVPLSLFSDSSEQESDLRHLNVEFLFVGRLWLFGPERVCSVRNAVANLVRSPIADSVLVVNTTSIDQMKMLPYKKLDELYSHSSFCLVTKADSYSTAALYNAVQSGCIPIIISDWLAPAFNWAIPWSRFAIRISEQDFLASPSAALIAVRKDYGEKLPELRQEMKKWAPLLSYATMSKAKTSSLHENLVHYTLSTPVDKTHNSDKVVVPALELFLFETLYHPGLGDTPQSSTDPKETGLSCETPYHCPLPDMLLPVMQLNTAQNGIVDERSFLCQNVHRLVGQYKMVYNQKCVRILWPLRPGHFKPFDQQRLSDEEKEFVTKFHQIGYSPKIYPYESAELVGNIKEYRNGVKVFDIETGSLADT